MAKTTKKLSTAPITTVASVELYEKTIKKASKAKASTAETANHTFAPDGKTHVTPEFHNAASTILGMASNHASLTLQTQQLNGTLNDKALVVWSRFETVADINASKVFAELIVLGYIPADSVTAATSLASVQSPDKIAALESAVAKNVAEFGTKVHPLYTALMRNSPKQRAANAARAAKPKQAKPANAVAVETKGLNVAPTDVHIIACVGTYMESKPTDLSRAATLKAVAKALGFELEGFKSI
jgi:hypothetical protein